MTVAITPASSRDCGTCDAQRCTVCRVEDLSKWRARIAPVDPVERPAHYTQGDIECIDAIKAQLTPDEYRGFLRGQVAKYLWRMGLKGDSRTDAAKSHWYLSRLMRELGGGK